MVERFNGRLAQVLKSHHFNNAHDLDTTYASAQVTLKSGDRTWMLVSTTKCVDIWALQT